MPYELMPVEGSPRKVQLFAEWELGEQYELLIDSASVQGALGHTNNLIKQEFKVRKEEEYGALFIQVMSADTGYVVQLLNNSDKPVRSMAATADGRADFYYLKPGEYYVRCFQDRNADGVWSTGEYDSGLRPEDVYYFPKPLTVKAQWEVEQQWDIMGIPVMKQKPEKITKQKPDKEKKVKEKNKEREAAMRRSGGNRRR
jgi:uncharacterized protein (DUF2141 family)